MSSLLNWSDGRLEHRSLLKTFMCTESPVKRRIRKDRYEYDHPRIWEWQVQSKIRTFEPPYHYPIQMLVGEDDHGLGAVSVYEELDGPGQVELCFMAVAHRLRFKGGGYADEMWSHTWDAIEARAIEQGVTVVSLSGLVHEGNEYSQKFCRRMKMRHTGMLPDSPFQQWSATHILGRVDFD